MITGNEPTYPCATPVVNRGMTIRQAYKMAAIQSGMFEAYLLRVKHNCDGFDNLDRWAGNIADAMIEEDNRHG